MMEKETKQKKCHPGFRGWVFVLNNGKEKCRNPLWRGHEDGEKSEHLTGAEDALVRCFW